MTEEQEACIHHYMLEAAHGRTVEGVCRKCGKVKEFEAGMDFNLPPVRRSKAGIAVLAESLAKDVLNGRQVG